MRRVTPWSTFRGHCSTIREAVKRAGIAPEEVEDVLMGCASQQGTQGYNLARISSLVAGLPVTTAAMTMDRQCSSGLMAIATASKQIICD
ncbi:MAG: acetyl-CoA C-acyltransferase, partial [Bacteroidetes bacterium]|nr:acetyl-CoA C-acyltransferase [Bacteroidota bacterium]